MEFKGVEFPEVYIIDFDEYDESKKYPMSGPRGDFTTSLLGSYSLLDKTRYSNWFVQRKDVVISDIERSQPKVVITFGGKALKELGITSRRIVDVTGSIYDVKFGDFTVKVLTMTSPTYILKMITKDPETVLRFSRDLYKSLQIINGDYVDIFKDKRVLSARSYNEFMEIYDKYLKDSPEIAYDIETNARPPMFEGSEIIGFSIADKETGVYVSHKSLDFTMDEVEIEKIWDKTLEILDSKSRLVIHNTMYERPYTLYCKNYEIPYSKADDTLVMARLLRNSQESAGLKYQAQKNLNYPDWENDTELYIDCISKLVGRVGLGPKKYKAIYEEIVRDKRSVFSIVDDPHEVYTRLSDIDKSEISGIVERLRSVVLDLYTTEEISGLDRLVSDKIVEAVEQGGIRDSTIPYNWIPDRILTKYGAIDSLATYDLRDYYLKKMDEESTDVIDLRKGYENWLEHMYVAYIMERNGMYWDDDVAQRDREFLSEQSTRCLKSMLRSSAFEPMVLRTSEWRYRPIILSDYMPTIARSQGYEVIYNRDTEKYTLKLNGKRISRDRISEIIVRDNYIAEYTGLVVSLFRQEVDRATSYKDLKTIYNPSSSTSSDIPREILMTPDLQMGGRIVKLHTLSESPEFNSLRDKLPAIDLKFLQIADILCNPDRLREIGGEDWYLTRRQIYEGFCDLYNNHKDNIFSQEIREIVMEKESVSIESFDDGGIINIYDNLVVTGIDQDRPESWTPEFEWMINFRLYKKSSKIITSYIDGTVGRKSVAVVDKDKLRRGQHGVGRKRWYFEDSSKIGDDEDYLVSSKWSPNTAETGRWRSAMHTIPWGSQVKKYYSSRFVGGTVCCPDYSQMEVRTLAAISKDENMLELFYSGKDFHTETAKKIYRQDEVTTAERRFSKTATFSLLYGAMEESFANNYCKGDLEYARMVYDGFFEAYPRVKEWVDARHEEVQRDHRVSLELSNRFIPIVPDGDGVGSLNSMLRKSQNYPIQAQSADLTGCVVFDIQKYIEENNLKSLVFMYVHDSIEVDIYPYELLQFIHQLKFLLNDSPMKRMGLPSKADVLLGKSLGHEIELKSIETSEDMTEGTMILEGYKDEIDETIAVWRKAYKTVDVSDEDYEEEFVSMSELFILRKAYTPTLGTLRHKGTVKVHIKYYK